MNSPTKAILKVIEATKQKIIRSLYRSQMYFHGHFTWTVKLSQPVKTFFPVSNESAASPND